MPTYTYKRMSSTQTGRTYTAESIGHTWQRSPRVNGKLVLQANPWSLTVLSQRMSALRTHPAAPDLGYSTVTRSHKDILNAVSNAESDLRGQLARAVRSNASASLGVGLASAKQSLNMFRNAGSTLGNLFLTVDKFYRTTRGKKRMKRFRQLINRGGEPAAGKVLEGFFGWQPLFADMFAACSTLSNPWPPTWVSRKAKWKTSGVLLTKGNPYRRTSWSAQGTSTYATGVHISNPNVWVANKLGLLNPVAVLWDLVPWSFLVNMVSNFGQIAGSLTDFCGLKLVDASLTRYVHLTQSGISTWTGTIAGKREFATGSGSMSDKSRTRTVGAPIPVVTPYLRLPGFNVGSTAIMGALLVQNVRRVTKRIGL